MKMHWLTSLLTILTSRTSSSQNVIASLKKCTSPSANIAPISRSSPSALKMSSLVSIALPQKIWSLLSWVWYPLFRSLLRGQWIQSFSLLPQLEKVEMPHYRYNFHYVDYASCWLTHSTLKEIDRLTHLQVLNISKCFHYLGNTKLKAFGHHLESLKKLETFICANSDISYEQVGTFAFARKLLKLSISGTIEDGKLENIDLGKLASLFPKLTHLKLVNFRNIVGDARMLNHMSGLVSLIVGKMKREDVETFGHYCRGRDINFLVLEESWMLHTYYKLSLTKW